MLRLRPTRFDHRYWDDCRAIPVRSRSRSRPRSVPAAKAWRRLGPTSQLLLHCTQILTHLQAFGAIREYCPFPGTLRWCRRLGCRIPGRFAATAGNRQILPGHPPGPWPRPPSKQGHGGGVLEIGRRGHILTPAPTLCPPWPEISPGPTGTMTARVSPDRRRNRSNRRQHGCRLAHPKACRQRVH